MPIRFRELLPYVTLTTVGGTKSEASENPTMRMEAPDATVCDQESVETEAPPLLSLVLTLSNVIVVVAPTIGAAAKTNPIMEIIRKQPPK